MTHFKQKLEKVYEEIMHAHHYEMSLKDIAPTQEAKMLFQDMAMEDMMMAEKIKKLYMDMYKASMPKYHHDMEMITDYMTGINELFEERIEIYQKCKDLYLICEDMTAKNVIFDIMHRNNIQTLKLLYIK